MSARGRRESEVSLGRVARQETEAPSLGVYSATLAPLCDTPKDALTRDVPTSSSSNSALLPTLRHSPVQATDTLSLEPQSPAKIS